MSKHNSLSEEELIDQACESFNVEVGSILDACEEFYMNGSWDQSGGSVDATTGHFYRVHRWIVITDSQGSNELQTFDDEDEAERAFDTLMEEYSQWDNE